MGKKDSRQHIIEGNNLMMVANESIQSHDDAKRQEATLNQYSTGLDTGRNASKSVACGNTSESVVNTYTSGITAVNKKTISPEVMKHYDELTATVFGIEVATTIAEILFDAEEKARQ